MSELFHLSLDEHRIASKHFSFAGQPNNNRVEHVPLHLEIEVVWIKPEYKTWPYIRQCTSWSKHSRGFPGHKTVAYVKQTRRGSIRRDPIQVRQFYVSRHDPYGFGSCPLEGIDPLTIQVGQLARSPKVEALMLAEEWSGWRRNRDADGKIGGQETYWHAIQRWVKDEAEGKLKTSYPSLSGE